MMGPAMSCLGVPPVDVDGIAHGLEGVEGDTDGKGEGDGVPAGQRQAVNDGQEAQAPGDKVPVLEEKQQRQIENHRGGNRHPGAFVAALLFAFVHQQAMGVVNGDGGEHDDDIHRLPPAIENKVQHQKGQVPPPQGGQVIGQQDRGQVGKEKEHAGKDQGRNLLLEK